MKTKTRKRLRNVETLEKRVVLDSTLVFNELMYHPVDDGEQLEFIEFHNQMAVDLDISDWRIAEGVDFDFPVGTIVPGGGYLVVARDPEALTAATGVDAMGPYVGRLSNRGETIELRDRNERLLDSIEYNDRGDWDEAADGHGPSLAKIDEDSFTNRSENWSQSFLVGGTPGSENFEDTTEKPPTIQLVADYESEWSYWDAPIPPPSNWNADSFNDEGWQSGAGPFFAGNARIEGADLNTIADVSATASSSLAGHAPEHAVNGNGLLDGGGHVTDPSVGNMWISQGDFFTDSPDLDPEITFDLGATQTIDAMRVWNLNSVESEDCCLDRGIAVADILTAREDGVFTTLIENQAFDIALEDDNRSAQVIDLAGVNARYVKIDVDTSNGIANHGDSFGFVGLSEVQFATFEAAGNTRVAVGPTTHYFRRSFSFNESPDRTTIEFDMLLDDAAVVYVNGAEVRRHNLPAGEITHESLALFEQKNAAPTDTFVVPGDLLVQGENVIAVEVHQASAFDSDMVFAMEMTTTTDPPPSFSPEAVALKINEVAAASQGQLFVELTNNSDSAIDVSGYHITTASQSITIPDGTTIDAGGYFVMPDLTGEVGDRIAVHNADLTMALDVVGIESRPIGLTINGDLAYVSAPTPGQSNTFDFNGDIVINEIMYNFRPTVGRPAVPPVLDLQTLVGLGSTWRYNDSGDDLPSNWYLTQHDVGDNWSEGPGLFGFETSVMPGPGIQTETVDPRENLTMTFYFETDFDLTASQLSEFAGYEMRHVIDDAAAIYINGSEVERFNLPEGELTSETRSTTSVRNAELSDTRTLPTDLFRVGSNRISVEVHQRSATSNDIVFGLQLAAGPIIKEGVAATKYVENDEEWIELFNRGDTAMDLSEWTIDSAVDFQFPAGQQIEPGQFLLVARDADTLRAKYPDIASQIIGEYNGSLGNKNDRIEIRDAHLNLADVVEYYQDGKWPKAADGRGSTLELQDADADNARGGAWQASDELADSTWHEYSYQGVTKPSAVGADNQWREFIMGMLADGTVLLDDIEIIKDPNGEAVNVLQNGTFESDTIGEHPAKWRLIGNHRDSEVIADPSDPSNKVLKFVANGAGGHMHNHGETTLMENGSTHRINNGVEYLIRYKARWVTGSNQLNTRLYFNRLARTTPIDRHDRHGTPGEANSVAVDNLGPTYDKMLHSPAVPAAGEPVSVRIIANDADSIARMTLWYRVDSGTWTSAEMEADGEFYAATIPGQAEETIVQFYVEGTDGLDNVTHFPRNGRDSRALYKVEDGLASDTGLHNLRMVLTPEDTELLHARTELMSDDPVGLTIIYNESTIFYDTTIRLSGSQRARPVGQRLSFKVSFPSDQLFRGVHNGLTLDRSESTGFGQREHIYHQGMTRAGGLPSEYNDLFNIITPLKTHTGGAEAQMARYSDIFFDEQYENGSSGQVYEYELVYYPTSTVDRDPESLKVPNPDSVVGSPITHLGDSNEDYRWTFLNKNNRAEDDYVQLMEFAKVFAEGGARASGRIEEVIDLDQWLRAFAFSVITGHGDNYGGDGAAHNLQLYVRPSDNRVVFLPHDLDAFFDARRAILPSADLRKLIQTPEREHMYYGHIFDMLTHVFNRDYMEHWTDLYQRLLPRQRFASHLNGLATRTEFLHSQIERVADKVDFTAVPDSANVDTSIATVGGKAWFDVREVRIAGSSRALPIEWTDVADWRVSIPVSLGENRFTLEAYDFQGNLIASKEVAINSSADNPVGEAIELTEINYNPHEPTAVEREAIPAITNDAFEFIELTNRSDTPVNLLGLQLTSGIEFTFPATILQAGESTLIVRDQEAFELRYGPGLSIAGEFESGRLANGGERLTLSDPLGNELTRVTYGDSNPWPESPDGVGTTLTRRPDTANSNKPASWTSSLIVGGTPGVDATPPTAAVTISEILANSGTEAFDAIELFNQSDATVDVGGWYLSDDRESLLKFAIPEGTTIPAGGFVVFNERHFNPTPELPLAHHFALSSNGDEVWLVQLNDQNEIANIVDNVHFGGSDSGQTLGRGLNGNSRLMPFANATLGSANSVLANSPVVISEYNFNPGAPSAAALELDPGLTSDDLEFVELHNPTDAELNLNGWRVRSAIDIDLDAITVPAGESIALVSFRPQDAAKANAFRSHYSIGNDVRLVGPYGGQLDDDWEMIRLTRPSTDELVMTQVDVDLIVYDDDRPADNGADGTGNSVTRISLTNTPTMQQTWVARSPTPGTVRQPGDVNLDGVVNVDDVDTVCAGVASLAGIHDVNADGIYDYADVEFLIHNLLDTHIGDANVDGTFDSRDFVQVFRSAEYEDGTAGNSLWSEGDWNCDGDFTTRDFVWAFRDGGYVLAAEQRLALAAAATANQSRQVRQSSEESKDKTPSQVEREAPAVKQLDVAEIDLIFDDIDLCESDGSETEPLGSIHQI